MNNRKNPCNINQRKWGDILCEPIYIPLNQRSYKWENAHLKNFMDDIIYIFEENRYNYLMGTIIIYKDVDGNDYIYDGQQRLISIAILLYILCSFCDVDNKIFMRVNINNPNILNDFHKELLEQEKFESIPKIHCINKDDMLALSYSFNNKPMVTKYFIKNTYDFIGCDDYFIPSKKYDCICGVSYKQRASFIKHIKLNHTYINNADKSFIYNAYDYIYTYITDKYDITKDKTSILNLINFIWNDTQINYCKCDDSEYVSRLFEWNNNRGKVLSVLDIIKNRIIIKISQKNRNVFYEQWEYWKNKKSSHNKQYAENLFMCSINICLNTFTNNNLESKFSMLLKTFSDNIYSTMIKLFNTMKSVENLYNTLLNNSFGVLFTLHSKVFDLRWDVFTYIIVPYYFYNGKKSNLIENIVQFYLRNICIKKLPKFNVFSHTESHIIKLINNKNYNFYENIKICMIKYNETNLCIKNFTERINITNLHVIKIIFLFIEIKKQNKGFKIPDNYSLEHIIPQQNNNIIPKENINNIGNLTLLEFENSNNGHKGNSSLQNINYILKVKSYSNSCFKTTNELPEKYKQFDNNSILDRSITIKNEINKYTLIK